MKKLLLIMLTMLSFSLFPQEKDSEKIIKIKAHVNKIVLSKDNMYRLDLSELAAVYHATKEFLPCLQSSIKENKKVLLEVGAYSLVVKSCALD